MKKTLNVNLWTRYWYATILPGGIGALLILIWSIGWTNTPDGVLASTVLSTGVGLVLLQVSLLLYWYFSTSGDNAYWMLIEEGGDVLDYCLSHRFMCPRLGTWLATITYVKRQIQAVWGVRGEDLITEEEIGALLGRINYTKMSQPPLNEFDVDDVFNFSEGNAFPEVTCLLDVIDPTLIRKLDAVDRETGECTKPGLAVAVGQSAEGVRNSLQRQVAGKSVAWLQFHQEEVCEVIKLGLLPKLTGRGLSIEGTTLPVISDFGVPAAVLAAIAKINTDKLAGQANVASAEQKAHQAVHDAKTRTTDAEGEAKAIERLADAYKKKLETRILALKAGGLEKEQIAAILEQEAITSGLPKMAPGLLEHYLTIGEGGAEFFKGLGESKGKDDSAKGKSEAKGAVK
jgi:hypothetical protein